MNKTILLPNTHDDTDSHHCFFRALVDQMPDLISVLDDTGTILFTSSSSEPLLGRAPGDRVGRSVFEFVHPDDVEGLRAVFDSAIRSGDTSPLIEYRYRHQDGDWRTLESIGRRCLDQTGAMAVLLQSRDATGRRTREVRRTHEETLKAVAQASAGIARDFDDLLIVLARHVRVLQSERPSAVQADARAIREALDGARVLVDQLMAFGRLDEVSPVESVEVNETVEEMADDLERLSGQDIEITYLLGATAARVDIARASFEQVVVALVAHACDAMPAGGRLTIVTRNTDMARPAEQASAGGSVEHIVIELTDTGVGMNADARTRAFEPAFTARAAELGLHTVLGIVRRAGGRVAIDSEVNTGTTVRVLLPISPKS